MNTLTQKEPQAVRPQPVKVERDYITPQVNVFEDKEYYVLEAEMPGVNKEGLEITLEGNVLTLVGRRAPDGVSGNLLYRESRAADFRRIFEVDPTVDSGRISAKVEQGILTLQLPKAEKAKPRKITIG
jgi:HSP20 family protein